MTPSAYTKIVFGSALLAAAVIALQPVHAAPAPTAPPPSAHDAQPCPPTPKPEARVEADNGSPILGCWNDVNLGVMIERPSDLTQGRPLGPDDGTRATSAVETYRKGQVKLPSSGGSTAGVVLQGITTSSGGQ